MIVAVKSETKSERVKLPGVEVRCANKVLKTYYENDAPIKKLKTCNALLGVAEGAGVFKYTTKCSKCKNMVKYDLTF